jgi:predicted nuclease of predicted toxin-antitoxin system
MKVLLDQGLPRSAAKLLRDAGTDAVHTAECGLATATDAEILEYARREDRFVVTLDADFHAILVLCHAVVPSVIRIRIEGLRAEALVNLVQAVHSRCGMELAKGAMVSVTNDRIRIRRLPM